MQTTKPKNSETVNVAVVGLGFMGVTHLRAYLEAQGARVVAVCDAVRLPVNGVLPGVAGNIKKSDDINLGPNVNVCRKLEEVLANPDVELVDLCTPTPLHPEQAIAALGAGKNVLCEKPLARTSARGRDILRALETARGFLMPAMCMRFWPGWSWLKEVVAKADLWSRPGRGVPPALRNAHLEQAGNLQRSRGRSRRRALRSAHS